MCSKKKIINIFLNMNYIFFILKENWNLPTFLRKKKFYFWKGGTEPPKGAMDPLDFYF